MLTVACCSICVFRQFCPRFTLQQYVWPASHPSVHLSVPCSLECDCSASASSAAAASTGENGLIISRGTSALSCTSEGIELQSVARGPIRADNRDRRSSNDGH